MSSYASRSRPDQVGEPSESGSRMTHHAQAGFREELLIRDGACMLTDEVSSLVCDAAHVVPQSRPDVTTFAHFQLVLTDTQVYKEVHGNSYGGCLKLPQASCFRRLSTNPMTLSNGHCIKRLVQPCPDWNSP